MPEKINFTKQGIQRLPVPSAGRTYIYDTKTPGLTICVTAAGTKTFYTYRKVNGRPERIRIGAWPEWTVEKARIKAATHNGKIAEGQNPNEKRRSDRSAPTLGYVFDDFLEMPTRTKAKRPKSPKTVADYRYQFKMFLEPWRTRKLASITRSDVEKLHNRIAAENGYYLANRVLALLKALYNTAADDGYAGANPAARVRAYEEKSRERFLQADELPRFFEALEAEPSEKVRDFIKLALFTGQRRSNVLSMRWEDLNLDRGVWTIPQTKTGEHVVPLPKEAVAILRRRQVGRATSGPTVDGVRQPSDYVLPGRHGEGSNAPMARYSHQRGNQESADS